jgi:hypothetical protein
MVPPRRTDSQIVSEGAWIRKDTTNTGHSSSVAAAGKAALVEDALHRPPRPAHVPLVQLDPVRPAHLYRRVGRLWRNT